MNKWEQQVRAFQPKNLNAQVVQELGLRIVSGAYPVGEKLPVEAELCLELGVSRPLIREAVKTLSSKGLLQPRPKTGTVVKPRDQWNLLDADILSWIIQSSPEQEFLDMLFELRSAFEPGASELAALKAKPENLKKILQALVDMEAAPSPEALMEPDLRFHQAIADAGQNHLISFITGTLHTALAASIQLTSRHPDTHALSLPRHKAVYDAICARDSSAAREATLILLRESRRDFDLIS